MKTILLGLVLFLVGCQSSHTLPRVSGDLEPVNSAEVMSHGQ